MYAFIEYPLRYPFTKYPHSLYVFGIFVHIVCVNVFKSIRLQGYPDTCKCGLSDMHSVYTEDGAKNERLAALHVESRMCITICQIFNSWHINC